MAFTIPFPSFSFILPSHGGYGEGSLSNDLGVSSRTRGVTLESCSSALLVARDKYSYSTIHTETATDAWLRTAECVSGPPNLVIV